MTETTTADPHRIEPLHEVTDGAKLAGLIASMEAGGWQGAPIVVIVRGDGDPLAFTGSHRLEAAREVGIDVPTVELRDLFADAGLDYHALLGEYLEAGFELYDAVVRISDELPDDVRAFYGLDAH